MRFVGWKHHEDAVMSIKLVIKISISEQERSRKVKISQSVTSFVKSNIPESSIKLRLKGKILKAENLSTYFGKIFFLS